MKPISFKYIYDIIKTELQKKSIDAVYNNTHEYFENNRFLKNKMIEHIHNVIKDQTEFKISPVKKAPKLYFDDDVLNSFYIWFLKNFEIMENYEGEIEKCNNKLSDFKKTKLKITNSIAEENNNKSSIQTNLDSILSIINQAKKRKKPYENQIKLNNKEIEKIKATTEFNGKKPYEDRIKELENHNIDLPKIYEEENAKLKEEFSKINNLKQKHEKKIAILLDDLKNINDEYNQLKNVRQTLIDNPFDIENETKLKNEIDLIFFKRKDYKYDSFFNESLFDTELFKESFPLFESIAFEKIKFSLLKILNSPIPCNTKNEYIDIFRKRNSGDYLQLSPYNNTDDIAAIFLAISLSFHKKNIIEAENGIIYLNLGNGILVKFLIRENIERIDEDILLIGTNKGQLVESKLIYETQIIFGGYTNSGFITNVGIYLIEKDLIFEIYFEASALLLNSNTSPLFQMISNNKKKSDNDDNDDDDDYYYY